MTRKRFVKLMMARGYSRNEANALALVARYKGDSYEKAYRMATIIPDLVDRLTEAFENVVDTAWRMAKALTAGFAAFGEAFRSAMEDERKAVEAEVYDVNLDNPMEAAQ